MKNKELLLKRALAIFLCVLFGLTGLSTLLTKVQAEELPVAVSFVMEPESVEPGKTQKISVYLENYNQFSTPYTAFMLRLNFDQGVSINHENFWAHDSFIFSIQDSNQSTTLKMSDDKLPQDGGPIMTFEVIADPGILQDTDVSCMAQVYGSTTGEYTHLPNQYFNVHVAIPAENPDPAVSLKVQDMPKKTTYHLNEAFSVAGGTLVYSENGNTQIIDMTAADVTVSAPDMSTVGQKQVEVSYKGQKAVFNISVIDPTNLILKNQPSPVNQLGEKQPNYWKGQIFDVYDDGVLLYTDASNKTITVPITKEMCTGYSMDQVGQQRITVTYEGMSVTYTIEVKEDGVESIRLVKKPDKLLYQIGEKFDAKGAALEVTSFSGKIDRIDIETSMCSGYDMNLEGMQNVEVNYEGKTLSFLITVLPGEVENLALAKQPTPALDGRPQPAFIQDQDFAIMDDGILSFNYKGDSDQRTVSILPEMCSGYDLTAEGKTEIQVTYGGQSVAYEANVVGKQITNVELLSLPEKTTYIAGIDTVIDFTGAQLNVVYNNGKAMAVDITPEMCSGYDTSVIGEQEVVVKYDQFEIRFPINVIEAKAESLSIVQTPKPVEFTEGTPFQAENGIAEVHYQNGATQEVAITPEMCSGYDMNQIGEQSVTVIYDNVSAKYQIYVVPKKVTGMTLAKAPDKLTYVEGETLDTSGGLLDVTYNNGTAGQVSLEPGMCGNYHLDQIGVQTVTVTYNGYKTSFEVTVTPKTAVGIKMYKVVSSEFMVGQDFRYDGAAISILFNNGTEDVIGCDTKGVSISAPDMNIPGVQSVSVEYSGFTTSYDITVYSYDRVNAINEKLSILPSVKEENPALFFDDDKALAQDIQTSYSALSGVEKACVVDIDKAQHALDMTNVPFVFEVSFDGGQRAIVNGPSNALPFNAAIHMPRIGEREGQILGKYTVDYAYTKRSGEELSCMPQDKITYALSFSEKDVDNKAVNVKIETPDGEEIVAAAYQYGYLIFETDKVGTFTIYKTDGVDADGDGVVDGEDGKPVDPKTPTAATDNPGTGTLTKAMPIAGIIALWLVGAAVILIRRRKDGKNGH